MYGGHPYDCTIKSHPSNCRYCRRRVVYWECWHGSKVVFDPPNGGEHICSARSDAHANPSLPRPSGKAALTTLSGVSFSVQSEHCGLMPGMMRGVFAEIGRSWARMPESSARETVRIDPLGDESETLIGEVSDAFEIDLAARFAISPNSIGAKMLGETFPGLRVTQITILADDFLNDPYAVDKMSYTAWCPSGVAPRGLAKRAFVAAEVSPRDFMGVIGRRWVAESVEEL